VPGRSTAEVIPEVLSESLNALPIAKPMRWGDSTHAFLRPVHWLVVMLDGAVVPCSALGVDGDRITYGHRFHAPEAITLDHCDEYPAKLLAAKVQTDPAARATLVQTRVQELAAQIGGKAELRASLLDEVVNLTEWPVPILCTIPAEFMRLPSATIVTTIEVHQRYFPIYSLNTAALLPAFIGVANIDSLDFEQIRKGYERVVRPRLADADFFYQQDLKTPLEDLQVLLKTVTFQAKLGSVWDKSLRVAALARFLAPAFAVEADTAERAARFAKCDLMSRMVGEFPELQGEMGKTYALAQGESAALALSLDEVYQPRSAGANIASSALGKTLAVAERLDTLAGIFAAGMKPTGNKDAFGLRRAALGLARTLIEGVVRLDLLQAIAVATAQLPTSLKVQPELNEELYDFIVERLRAYYTERGIESALIDAVVERKPLDLFDFDSRLRACQAFRALPESTALSAANKRIRNILRKLDGAELADITQRKIDPALFEIEAEHALDRAVSSAASDTAPLFAQQRYVQALTRLAALQTPVDQYFDAVMVMADQPAVRSNRLASLQRLAALFLNVADVSVLG
jgi:glycyl-tRNA synthetase beta chain